MIIRSLITNYTGQVSISINIFPKIRRKALNTFPILMQSTSIKRILVDVTVINKNLVVTLTKRRQPAIYFINLGITRLIAWLKRLIVWLCRTMNDYV